MCIRDRYIRQRKRIYLFQPWIFFFISGRRIFQHLFFFLIMTDLIRKHPVIEKTTAADCLLYLGYLFFIWIDPYFYCPVYLSHPDSLYTDGLFQQVLYFKDFFCSLWHLIVQHLSAIFHNQNQTKTLNENYYLNSLCTLTYCLFRPSKFQEHIVLFSIIIYLLYQNKCFCDFLWIWADMLECAIHPITYRMPLKKW